MALMRHTCLLSQEPKHTHSLCSKKSHTLVVFLEIVTVGHTIHDPQCLAVAGEPRPAVTLQPIVVMEMESQPAG